MTQPHDARFQGVADTLYIPLAARILVSKRFPDYFRDERALCLEERFDSAHLCAHTPTYQALASAARYRITDQMIRTFIRQHPSAIILNLGCGLDTVCDRIGSTTATFCELDLPHVIEERTTLLGHAENELPLPCDLFDTGWMDTLDVRVPTLAIASGVLMYFHEDKVLTLMKQLAARFSHLELVFDAADKAGLRYANRFVRKTGNLDALMHFHVQSIHDVLRHVPGASLIEERPFFTEARQMLRNRLDPYTRTAMWVCDTWKRARIFHLRLV